MSKFSKLRHSPQLFFQDTRNPILRWLGARWPDRLAPTSYTAEFLYDPLRALANSSFPPLAQISREIQSWGQRRRHQTILAHDSPMVSVVIAAHNAAATIASALTSLQCQRYKNLEIIVVDDASTDTTKEIVRKMMFQDPRVRLLTNQSNKGCALTRNVGMHAASGDFLTFQDADDQSAPDRIERQVAALLADRAAEVAVCDYYRVNAVGRAISINGRTIRRSLISMMFRRQQILSKIGYMRGIPVSEDEEYFQRITTVFGQKSERHIWKTLYFAGFNKSSLLFSHGSTQINADGSISHVPSTQRGANGTAMRAWHKQIREGANPYVAICGTPADELRLKPSR